MKYRWNEERKKHHSLAMKRYYKTEVGIRHREISSYRMKKMTLGIPKTEEHKRKIGLAHIGQIISHKHKEIIRLAMIGNKHALGYKHTKETRRKIGNATSKRLQNNEFRFLNTDIERKMKKELDCRQISYEHPCKRICIRDSEGWPKYVVPDFCLLAHPILIECDGDYWHGGLMSQICDKVRDHKLRNIGYKVLRFWGHEILQDVHKCGDAIEREFVNCRF
jgi:very-short-patch-repair endonuclease